MSTLDSALYVRADTDSTTVWAPRVHAAGKLGDSAGVDATYTVDTWTGASIDVVTAATEAIHEVRHELSGGAFYEFSDVTISAGYRHSRENDYWSNGGVLSASVDMANNNTTLAVSAFGSKDIVGRAGDPYAFFRKPQDSLGGRVTLTQVLDTKSLVQLSWETLYLHGYLASPYRYVALGGPGTCSLPRTPTEAELAPSLEGAASYCLPELHPDERLRHAAMVALRRAFGARVSMGLGYRFYFDDWGLMSHSLSPDFAFLLGSHGTLSLDYRYYQQNAASFYRARYGAGELPQFFTRDRKLSPLMTNRIGLEYAHEFELGVSKNTVLTLALRGALTRFAYRDFVGLTQVDALELSTLLGLKFR